MSIATAPLVRHVQDFTHFLARHEAHRQAIVDSGPQMVRDHYSPRHLRHAFETSL